MDKIALGLILFVLACGDALACGDCVQVVLKMDKATYERLLTENAQRLGYKPGETPESEAEFVANKLFSWASLGKYKNLNDAGLTLEVKQ